MSAASVFINGGVLQRVPAKRRLVDVRAATVADANGWNKPCVELTLPLEGRDAGRSAAVSDRPPLERPTPHNAAITMGDGAGGWRGDGAGGAGRTTAGGGSTAT